MQLRIEIYDQMARTAISRISQMYVHSFLWFDGKTASKGFQCMALCSREINRETVFLVQQFLTFQTLSLTISIRKIVKTYNK